jgi:hypothetical protein
MNECKTHVLAFLESVRNGETANNHPFVETFMAEASVRKAASAVNALSTSRAGEKLYFPSETLPPLD